MVSKLQRQLKELLPRLSKEAQKLRAPEAKKSYYLLKAVSQSPKPVRTACEARGESTKTFYKWAKRVLATQSLGSLQPLSRRPACSPDQVDPRIEKRICQIRSKAPFLGPERILNELQKTKFKDIPHLSTVYQVLRRNDLIKSEYRKKLTKKHMKRYRRPIVGYLQIDFKHVPYLVENKKSYQLSCVDHHSTWRFIRCYEHKNLESVEDFFSQLEEHCPFPILQIQTDNDMSFTDKYRVNTDGYPTGLHVFDVWCSKHNIEHKLIPIGQKELNGKVENTHKQDDREFFSQVQPSTIVELQNEAIRYNFRWNNERQTKALGWKTPTVAVVHSMYFLNFLKLWLHSIAYEKGLTLTQIDSYGNVYMPIPKAKKSKVKKPKRESALDRYLRYLDWDEKMRLKAAIVLPMSPSSSLGYPIISAS